MNDHSILRELLSPWKGGVQQTDPHTIDGDYNGQEPLRDCPAGPFIFARLDRGMKDRITLCISFNTHVKGDFSMKATEKTEGSCKNVFKHGRPPTKEEYTKVWIDLINQIERLKSST